MLAMLRLMPLICFMLRYCCHVAFAFFHDAATFITPMPPFAVLLCRHTPPLIDRCLRRQFAIFDYTPLMLFAAIIFAAMPLIFAAAVDTSVLMHVRR